MKLKLQDGSTVFEKLGSDRNAVRRLKSIRSLDLFQSSEDSLELSRELIQHASKLDQLRIEEDVIHPQEEDDESWTDLDKKPGVITSTLFRTKLPFHSCSPMILNSLKLCNINITWASQTYMKVISFPNLRELSITGCDGAEASLATLSKSELKMTKLTRFSFSDEIVEPTKANRLGAALSRFLKSISCLRSLYLNLRRGFQPVDVSSICHHAKTLESLVIHTRKGIRPRERWVHYNENDFEKLCRECKKLQQVVLTLPRITATWDWINDDFNSYLVREMRSRATADLANNSPSSKPFWCCPSSLRSSSLHGLNPKAR